MIPVGPARTGHKSPPTMGRPEIPPIQKDESGGRGGRNRTINLRFWRPTLCQLSYTPTKNHWVSRGRSRKAALSLTAPQQTDPCCASKPEIGGPGPTRDRPNYYAMILATTPAPTVLPPSRMAKRRPSSMAIGLISLTVIVTLSPGITISLPSGNSIAPVTSVVRK